MFICGIKPMLNILLCLHIYPVEYHQLLPAMLYSGKVIKDTDMNVWKYIYIRFFKIRRRIIGRDGADEFAAMLFVAFFDVLLFFGIMILIDKLVNNTLSTKYEPFFFAFYILGMFTIDWFRNRSMCKNGAFERIKKEVENEPEKLKWSLLSILYMIFVILFFLSCCYIGKYGLNL